MVPGLPEPATAVQTWLSHHMGQSAPLIQMRMDTSLFIDTASGLMEACAVTDARTTNGSRPRASLWCVNSTGERCYYQTSPIEPVIIVSRKPAGSTVWTYERWQDGKQDLKANTNNEAIYSPGASDPEVDSLLLQFLWPQQSVSDDDLANRLGVSIRTIRRRAFELKLPHRLEASRNNYDRHALRQLWSNPAMTEAAICQRLGISTSELNSMAKQWKLPAREHRKNRPRHIPALQKANQKRSQAASISTQERTRAVLSLPETKVPPILREAGILRLQHPQKSLAELAELNGCTKDAYTGRLRRLRKLYEKHKSTV